MLIYVNVVSCKHMQTVYVQTHPYCIIGYFWNTIQNLFGRWLLTHEENWTHKQQLMGDVGCIGALWFHVVSKLVLGWPLDWHGLTQYATNPAFHMRLRWYVPLCTDLCGFPGMRLRMRLCRSFSLKLGSFGAGTVGFKSPTACKKDKDLVRFTRMMPQWRRLVLIVLGNPGHMPLC